MKKDGYHVISGKAGFRSISSFAPSSNNWLILISMNTSNSFSVNLLYSTAGAISNNLYHNEKTGFKSYFLTFGDGARLEIMNKPDMDDAGTY